MVYNSKKRSTIFEKISKIELVCVENGVKETRIIEDVVFEPQNYKDDYVTLGAAAYAEFETLKAESVRITVDVPDGRKELVFLKLKFLESKKA